MGLLDQIKPPELLKITAHPKKEREGEGGGGLAAAAAASLNLLGSGDENTFEAPVNIDSYTQSLGLNFAKKKGINSSSAEADFISATPQEVKFKIILDNTKVFSSPFGAIGDLIGSLAGEEESIFEKVEKFKAVCYDYNGEIHAPNYLRLKWGEIQLDCRLLSVDINFTLFDGEGKALRAELDAVFIEDISDEVRKKREGRESPDITHTYQLRAGDTLPLLAKRVYGSSEFYLPLARFNELDHFRALGAGAEIVLPPLAELEGQ